MKYLTTLLLLFVSMNISASPIKWSSVDDCNGVDAAVCGSFYFDIDTGDYSFVDLSYSGPYFFHEFSRFAGGNQYQMSMVDYFPNEPHSIDLRLAGYDLSAPVQQQFNWEFSFGPVFTSRGVSTLMPSFEPPPNPVPSPATLLLFGIALTAMRLARRKRSDPPALIAR
jgi:hypothetical protein